MRRPPADHSARDSSNPHPGFEQVLAGRRINLIHCSYHKCLTVYYRRVMDGLFNRCQPWGAGYRHYNSHLRDFYEGFEKDRIASINNRALDLERLGDFRISRFIRDPRDLVVSGYFYHKRGAEAWVSLDSPTAEDWYFANGVVPAALRSMGTSFARYLQSIPKEDGLLAELEFRARHFESMTRWPERHPAIRTYRYEEILGHEQEVFQDLFELYELSPVERALGGWLAKRHSLGKRRRDPHIRNPAAGQWREHFTPRVRRAFDAQYAGLVRQLGYPAS